ncbi:hypothetical protein AB1N83_008424 [Pleurotus pulmonarius]
MNAAIPLLLALYRPSCPFPTVVSTRLHQQISRQNIPSLKLSPMALLSHSWNSELIDRCLIDHLPARHLSNEAFICVDNSSLSLTLGGRDMKRRSQRRLEMIIDWILPSTLLALHPHRDLFSQPMK